MADLFALLSECGVMGLKERGIEQDVIAGRLDIPLSDIGMDSLAAMEFASAWNPAGDSPSPPRTWMGSARSEGSQRDWVRRMQIDRLYDRLFPTRATIKCKLNRLHILLENHMTPMEGRQSSAHIARKPTTARP